MQRTLTFMHKMLEVKKKWGETMTRALVSGILMRHDPRSKVQKGDGLHWQVGTLETHIPTCVFLDCL